MIKESERAESPAGSLAPSGTWMQITFTLDTKHYRVLWNRAESVGLSIPDFVRESVMDALNDPTFRNHEKWTKLK